VTPTDRALHEDHVSRRSCPGPLLRSEGDNVVVIAGRDKGKRGSVTQIVDDQHVVVAGINQVKKHTRPNPMKNQPGGIITKEIPIHVSNVAVYNPVTQKADRIGFRTLNDGRKVRFFKSNGEVLGA
jgi:large subunit ribosomal protein L24